MAKESPDSGVDNNERVTSYADQESFEDEVEADDDYPIMGTCRAMYQFDGKSYSKYSHNSHTTPEFIRI